MASLVSTGKITAVHEELEIFCYYTMKSLTDYDPWSCLPLALRAFQGKESVLWVPRHLGITGNELVDAHAHQVTPPAMCRFICDSSHL